MYVCGGGITGLAVTGFIWTTGHTVHSNVLDSTVSPFFAIM